MDALQCLIHTVSVEKGNAVMKKKVTRKNKNTSRITLPSSQCNEQLYIVKCKLWNGNTVNPALFEIFPCLSCILIAVVWPYSSPIHPPTPYCEMSSKYIGINMYTVEVTE